MDYDFTTIAYGGQVLDVFGSFFKYKSGTGTIKVTPDNGSPVALLPGQGIRAKKPFSRLLVTDLSGQPNSGILLAGADELIDDRIAGTVNIAGTVGITGSVAINDVISSACRNDFWSAVVTVGSNQVAQHVAPAANVNGILLRNLDLIMANAAGGLGSMRLIAGAIAPTLINHAAPNSISLAYVNNDAVSTTKIKDIDILYRRLPAGWGIWSVTSISGAASPGSYISAAYEIL